MPKSLGSYTSDAGRCAFLPTTGIRASNQRCEKLCIETTTLVAQFIVCRWRFVVPQEFRLKPVCDQTRVNIPSLRFESA